jgi:MFS family permease
LTAALAIQSAAVLALPATVTMPVLLIPNVVLIGLCFGAMFTLMPAAVINAFGDTYWAENYGYVFRSYGYGAIVVAMGLGGAVADFSMTASFVVTGVLLLAAVWLACMIRDEKKKAVDVRENGDAPRTAVPIQPASARRSRAPKPKRERDTSRPPSRSRR